MKYCNKCKEVKDLSEFHKNKSMKDGLNFYCKSCRIEHNRNYHENNREELNERSRTYYKNNREDLLERKRNYYENNREEVIERNRNWGKNNPEKVREKNRRRRAMKKEVNENYTPEDERYTRLIFSEMCFKCKSKEDLTIDHNYPLSQGNALERDNAVLLCRSCNAAKGTKRPEEFYNDLEMYQLEYLLYMEY